MVAEEEDGAVVVDALLLEGGHQPAELGVDLHAHPQIDRPQLVPVGLGVALHAGVPADLGEDLRLAGAVRRPDTGRQLGPVDGGIIGLLHPVGGVGEGEAQEHTEGLVRRAGADPLDGGVHHLVVPVVVDPLLVQAQPALEVGVVVFSARLPPQAGVLRAGALLLLAAVVDLVGVALGPAGDLAGGQVVPVIHPDIIAGLPQLLEQGGLPRVQQMAHGAVTMHMGVQPGEEAAPAGHADRVLAIGIAKGDRVGGGEGVQVRGHRRRIAQMGQRPGPHLVRVEKDDVRLLCHALPSPCINRIPPARRDAGGAAPRRSRPGRWPPAVRSRS